MTNNTSNIFLPVKLLLLCMCIGVMNSSAQVKSHVKQILRVGQNMPDVDIKEIINYKLPTAKISDFKGKILILDFWATYCAPCIAMFPKTDSLEKQFKGEVQFLAISGEPKKKVKDFFDKMYNVRHLRPISVVNDTAINHLFYYSGIPYYVWIVNGKVFATTGPEEITDKNIKMALNGGETSFKNRNDIRSKELDLHNPVFVLSDRHVMIDTLARRDEISKQDILSYSIATKYMEATPGGFSFDSKHFSAVNVSIDYLYRYYYDLAYYKQPVRGAFDAKGKFEFEIDNPNLLNKITIPQSSNIKSGTIEMLNWGRENGICYEIIYPKGLNWQDKMKLLKQDIDRYFAKSIGFDTRIEKRMDSNANVLRCVDTTKLITSGGRAEETHDRFSYNQHNLPLSHLIGILSSYYFQNKKTSFVDKTGFKKPVDIEINCDMANVDSINEQLKKYGLKFSSELNEVDVLVFAEIKH